MNYITTLILICVFIVTLIAFHLLEKRNKINTRMLVGPKRGGYAADLLAQFIDGPVLSAAMKIVAFWLIVQVPAYAGGMADWSWPLQFAVFFLANDFGRYWLHRWHHEIGWMWRIHRVHHSPVQMDALSASRVHVFEGAIKYGLLVLPFRFLGVAESVMLTYTIMDMIKAFWHHANLNTHIGPLNYVLNSAELHWWHHAMHGPGQHSNYGSVLSIWDRLFGTFHWPKGQWPERIGVEGCERFPQKYREMFLSAFMSDEAARARYSAERAPEVAPQAVEPPKSRDGRTSAAGVGRDAELITQPAAE